MRLSDAIVMGYSEIEHNSYVFLKQQPNGSCVGCALGAALYAMGEREVGGRVVATLEMYWPWLTTHQIIAIGNKFHEVRRGELSIEALVEWVRTQEPPEPEAVISAPVEILEPVQAT